METLGISGIVSHSEQDTTSYNKLLKILGTEGMLMQFERWMDADQLSEIIQFAIDNLNENGHNYESDPEDKYWKACQTYSERHSITDDDEW